MEAEAESRRIHGELVSPKGQPEACKHRHNSIRLAQTKVLGNLSAFFFFFFICNFFFFLRLENKECFSDIQ